MGLFQEFREFAVRGNVVDMAVGIVIGGAFGKIVTSLVNDVIMPPIGAMMGGIDFAELTIVVMAAETDVAGEVISPEVAISYGRFINTIIDFIIVAFAIFMVVRMINSARKRFERQQAAAAAAPVVPPADVVLLTEIRDMLKQNQSNGSTGV